MVYHRLEISNRQQTTKIHQQKGMSLQFFLSNHNSFVVGDKKG